MRIVTNEGLIRRNRQIAQVLFFVSFGVLILGLFVINAQQPGQSDALSFLLPTAILPVAFLMTMLSVRMTNLWVRHPRPEVVIPEAAKVVGSKGVLFNYLHFPARHVLIGPSGVYAIVTRFQDGTFTVNGDRWVTHRSLPGRIVSLFRFDGIGNPTADAQRAAAHVKQLLSGIAPDVPVQPIIVFVDSRATITLNEPTVPVVFADSKLQPNLRDLVKGTAKSPGSTLTAEQIAAFEAATVPQ